jgi:hypothetical protein
VRADTPTGFDYHAERLRFRHHSICCGGLSCVGQLVGFNQEPAGHGQPSGSAESAAAIRSATSPMDSCDNLAMTRRTPKARLCRAKTCRRRLTWDGVLGRVRCPLVSASVFGGVGDDFAVRTDVAAI